jgi:7,8-dihydropterin-6-yl-methyl-4-(beta-D-ribofuranosyl)aminobenzene 5'-phosphate synthase
MNRDRIYAIIGGTHLAFATEDQFAATMKVIDRYKIERMGVSHCTGQPQASRLYSKLKERFFFGSVGYTMEA